MMNKDEYIYFTHSPLVHSTHTHTHTHTHTPFSALLLALSSTRTCADSISAVTSGDGEVSFVDFLLSIVVYPDDPRYSRFTKHDAPNEPAGPETNLWITVRYGRYCSSGGYRPTRRLAA